MPMTREKIIELAHELRDKSKADQVEWSESPYRNGYQTTVGPYTIRIEKESYEETGGYTYYLRIFNVLGRLVDEITDDEIIRVKHDAEEGIVMDDLFKFARRSAMGAEQVLDSILTTLSGKKNSK